MKWPGHVRAMPSSIRGGAFQTHAAPCRVAREWGTTHNKASQVAGSLQVRATTLTCSAVDGRVRVIVSVTVSALGRPEHVDTKAPRTQHPSPRPALRPAPHVILLRR